MVLKEFSTILKQRGLTLLFFFYMIQQGLSFTQAEYFISDLETNTESKFKNEVASWKSSITLATSIKYYDCAGTFLLGGSSLSLGQSQMGQSLSRQYTNLPPHKFIKYSFVFWVIDSWDWNSLSKDTFQIQFDNLPVVEGFGIDSSLSSSYICGGTLPDIAGVQVFGWIAHSSLTLDFRFILKFDEDSINESFGVRDLELLFTNDNPGADYICGYTDTNIPLQNQATCKCEPGKYSSSSGCLSCSKECAGCNGSGSDKCIECAEGYYFDGKKCSKCDSSCSKCTGPQVNQCTECLLPGFALFNGICISSGRCTSPLVHDYSPEECHSPCSLGSFTSWNESCYPPCPDSSISDLSGVCKTCKSLSTQYLKATDGGHQYTFQLSPSSCNLDIENVRRYLRITERAVGSVGSFSFQVKKSSANNYLINLVLDQSVLESTSLDLKLSYLTGSLEVPKKFVLDDTLKAIAEAIPTVKTGLTGAVGGSFIGTLALGATAGLWSIVSFQQFVGYFLFINVEYPPVVELFLSMLQISLSDILPNPLASLTGSLSQDIIAADANSVTRYDPPMKFVKYDMSSFFIENGGALIAMNVFLLVFLALVLLLKKIKALEKNILLIKLKVYIKWNTIARTFLENGIPLSLAVFLYLRVAECDQAYLAICFALAVISLLYIFVFVFFFLKTLVHRDNEHLNKKHIKRMYGTLYEGVVLSREYSKYYNVVILIRGILLMGLITFFEAHPALQILPLIFFNIVLVAYMWKQVTFEDRKLDFIVKLKEILVLFGEICMLFLCLEGASEWYYKILGYLIVLFLGIALVVEVGYMLILQICEIKNLWRKIKSGWKMIKEVVKVLKTKKRKENKKVRSIKIEANQRLQSQQDMSQISSSSDLIIITNLS